MSNFTSPTKQAYSNAAMNTTAPSPSPQTKQSTSTHESVNYSELIKTITDLQSNLQDAIITSSDLKEENQQLKLQYQETLNTLQRTRKRHKETNTALENQLQLTLEKESSIASSITQWKTQLQTYKEQVLRLGAENQQSSSTSSSAISGLPAQGQHVQDKRLRQQIQHEVESEYSSRYTQMESQIEAWRDKFMKANQNLEYTQVELKQLKQSFEKKFESIEKNHQDELSALRCDRLHLICDDISHLCSPLSVPGETQDENLINEQKKTIKSLQQEINEISLIEKEIRNENIALRQHCLQDEDNHQTKISQYKTETLKMQSQLASLEVNQKRLENKIEQVNQEKKLLRKQINDARQSQNETEKENNISKSMLTNEKQNLLSSLEQTKNSFEHQRLLWETEKESINKRNEYLNQQLQSTQSKLKRLQANAIANLRSASKTEAKVREEAKEATLNAQNQNKILESTINQLQNTITWNEIEQQSLIDRITCERDESRNDANKAIREKELIAQSLAVSQNTSKQLRTQLTSIEKKSNLMSTDIDLLQKQVKNTEEHRFQLQSHAEKLKEQIEKANDVIDKLKEDAEKEKANNEQRISEIMKNMEEDKMKAKVHLKEEVRFVYLFMYLNKIHIEVIDSLLLVT